MLVTLARLEICARSMEPHFGLCYEGRLSRELASAGVPVHMLGRVRISRPWTAWRARRRLRELLRREHYDAVICHSRGHWWFLDARRERKGKKWFSGRTAVTPDESRLERMARRTCRISPSPPAVLSDRPFEPLPRHAARGRVCPVSARWIHPKRHPSGARLSARRTGRRRRATVIIPGEPFRTVERSSAAPGRTGTAQVPELGVLDGRWAAEPGGSAAI